jgi:ketosteroid isomerase-like protein
MALAEHALPFGLREVWLIPLDNDGTEGTPVKLPVARTFTFNDTEEFETLEGDDATAASHGAGPTVDWELEGGGLSLSAWAALSGATVTTSGTTPAAKRTLTKKTTHQRPYFNVVGRAISDSGGDVMTKVYRCKADGDLEGGFENGAFMLTSASGKGYGNNFGATPTNDLYTFENNETETPFSPGP